MRSISSAETTRPTSRKRAVPACRPDRTERLPARYFAIRPLSATHDDLHLLHPPPIKIIAYAWDKKLVLIYQASNLFEDRFVLRLIVRMWVFPLATP